METKDKLIDAKGLNAVTGSPIICTAEGDVITLTDSDNKPLQELVIYGKSTQDGTPSPDNPVDITSVENPEVVVTGKNLFNPDADKLVDSITSYSVDGSEINVRFPSKYRPIRIRLNRSSFVKDHTYKIEIDETIHSSFMIQVSFFKDSTNLFSVGLNTSSKSTTFTLSVDPNEYRDVFNGNEYFALSFYLNDDEVINTDIMVKGLRVYDTAFEMNEYEPYKGETLSVSKTLRGIPVSSGGNYTDSDGQMWLGDTLTINADGTGEIVRNVGVVEFTSSSTWYRNSKGNYYTTEKSGAFKPSTYGVCDILTGGSGSNSIYVNPLQLVRVNANIDDDTENGIKDAMAGHSAMLPLATPTTESLTAEEVAEILQTYKPTTVITNDQGAHLSVSYIADTKSYIDSKFNDLATALARIS